MSQQGRGRGGYRGSLRQRGGRGGSHTPQPQRTDFPSEYGRESHRYSFPDSSNSFPVFNSGPAGSQYPSVPLPPPLPPSHFDNRRMEATASYYPPEFSTPHPRNQSFSDRQTMQNTCPRDERYLHQPFPEMYSNRDPIPTYYNDDRNTFSSRQDCDHLGRPTVQTSFPHDERYTNHRPGQRSYFDRGPVPRFDQPQSPYSQHKDDYHEHQKNPVDYKNEHIDHQKKQEYFTSHRPNSRDRNRFSRGPPPSYEQLPDNPASKHQERSRPVSHHSRSEFKAEGRAKQKFRKGYSQTDISQLFSPDSVVDGQSDSSRDGMCGQHSKKPQNVDNNISSTQEESPKFSRELSDKTPREKLYHKQKTEDAVGKLHSNADSLSGGMPGSKEMKTKQHLKQQMPKNGPLERNLSESSQESEKSTTSEISSDKRNTGRKSKERMGYRGKKMFTQINKDKFKSMPDLKHGDDVNEGPLFVKAENGITSNSQSATNHTMNEDVKTSEKTKSGGARNKQAHVRSKKVWQRNPDPNQTNQEMVPSFRKTKANIQIETSFRDTASLKEAINQNMDTSKPFSLQFVEDSIICSEEQGICTIFVQASSKQLSKHLIKTLCANLRKNLKKKVVLIEEKKEVKEDNSITKEQNVKKENSTIKEMQAEDNNCAVKNLPRKNTRKRVNEILENAQLHIENNNESGSKMLETESKHEKIPTKITVEIDKVFPRKEDLVELISTIVRVNTFKLLQDSVVMATSRTIFELEVFSKSDSKKIVRQINSSRIEGMHIRCYAVVGNVTTSTDLTSKAEHMQAEIKKTIDAIIRKTEKTLELHQQKMEKYEKALTVMKSSTYSEDDDDDWAEELALIDKLKEVCKQKDTFCSRKDELIEKARKFEPLSASTKDLSDLLESVGVECERLSVALPIYARRADIVKKISENQVSIILGETGSGKSTQLAQYIYEYGPPGNGLIVCTQPRKVAAITLAERVAKEMAGRAGEVVGYKTGLKKCMSAMTKILFTTDHCLLNECVADPHLSCYTCIIVDEAHERSIYTDLLLGMIKAALPARPDLRVIITSATIDPKIFIKYFKTSPELRVSGRTFPVEVVYSDPGTSQEFENFESKAVMKAVDVHLHEEPGDVLVFLTSPVEIMRCCEEFEKRLAGRNDCKCFPLHGQLAANEQRRVFDRLDSGVRKVVFATNCAETSITIDGIKYVIDTGVAKEVQYDSKRNICILGTNVISKSSADQRKGRAGRTGSGKCYRLFSEEGYRAMRDFTEPEILRVPLGQSLLKLAELGVDVKSYDFVQSPSVEAIDTALCTLRGLGALSSSDGITDIGRWISKLPFHPKEGVLIYHGNKKGMLYDSLVMASLIANGSNLFYKGLTESEAQTSARSKSHYGSTYGDIFTWMEVYKTWIKVPLKEQSKWCQEKGINYKVMNFTKQCVKEVVEILKRELKIKVEYIFASDESVDAELSLRKILFEANVASVCHCLGHVRAGYHALMADKQVHLHPSSTVLSHNSQPEWIVYTEFTKTSRDFIKGITIVEEDWVREAAKEGKLCVDINLAKELRIELVHREMVGSSVFRKLVGARYSQLRVWEDDLTNSGMKTVVVEANSELGLIDIFSTSPMNQDIADHIKSAKKKTIEFLKSGEAEIAVLKKTGNEPSGVRVVLGQGGCVKTLLMPDQSNKILIKKSGHDVTEEVIRAKFGVYGEIRECVRFKQSNLWGFIRYNSCAEAQAAVHQTCNDEENVAFLKIDKQFKSMLSRFEARLSWCRRPIKGAGTAFIKCPPIEKAGLVGKYILLPHGMCELQVSSKGDDLVCFKTARVQEMFIKKKVMDILKYDDSLKQDIHVTVVREQVGLRSQSELNNIKRDLSKSFSRYVSEDKFIIRLMSAKANAVNQVAFINFDSPTDGFQACRKLQKQLYVEGEPVEISPQLKTTIHVSKPIMNICKSRFEEIIAGLKKYKETEIIIRELKQGDFALDIKSENAMCMVEARELLQKELEGETIDCGANDLVRKLLRRQGKEALQKIESQCGVLIVINDRKEKIHIYGKGSNVSQTQTEINRYLNKLAEGKQVDVNLKGQGKPPGLMKALMKKYDNLHDDLTTQFSLSDVVIDFRQQKLSLFGPPECVDQALSSISELEHSILQMGILHSEKWMPDCVVCMCPVENSSDIYRLEACGHSYCLTCLKSQINVRLQDKQFPVVCAQEGCGTPLVWKDFCFYLQKRWTSEEELMEKSVSAFVAINLDKYRFCLTPECPIIYEVTKNEEGAEFNCPSCFVSLCTSCHTAYHAGLTCKMCTLEEESKKQLEKWINENPKQRKLCPGCKVGVEKSEGCNKMHCTSCHIYFCWLCLDMFKDGQTCYAHLAKKHGGFFDHE